MRDFFAEQQFPKSLSIEQKYNSDAAAAYRERVKALADGAAPDSLKPIPFIGYREQPVSATPPAAARSPAPARSPVPAHSKSSRSDSFGSGGGGDDDGPSAGSRPRTQGIWIRWHLLPVTRAKRLL